MATATTSGQVVWITGLAGAGKTTIAREVSAQLRTLGNAVVSLDGDDIREALGNALGHDRTDRLRAARAYARLCRLVAASGPTVVCSTISMFHEVQDWSRAHTPGYIEIYVRAAPEVLAARDQKGLHSRGRADGRGEVVGIEIAVEEPRAPDLIIDNSGSIAPADLAQLVVRLVLSRAAANRPQVGPTPR